MLRNRPGLFRGVNQGAPGEIAQAAQQGAHGAPNQAVQGAQAAQGPHGAPNQAVQGAQAPAQGMQHILAAPGEPGQAASNGLAAPAR